jgi:hypothetical protein
MVESAALIKKLQIKAGSRLWLINVPEAVAQALTAGAEIEPVKPGEACDGVIAFAHNPLEAEKMGRQAIAALGADGLLWMAYRKGAAGKTSGLTRDTGWEPLRAAGWDTVRSVSIDDEWTGLRFRPAALIGRR